MEIDLREIILHELIGLKVVVKDSKNRYQKGIRGEVIWETYNMLHIKTKNGKIKKLLKKDCAFVFDWKGYKVKVDGKLLVGRPEDRIKKKLP